MGTTSNLFSCVLVSGKSSGFHMKETIHMSFNCISGGKSHLMLVHNFMNYALLSVKFMSQINLVT